MNTIKSAALILILLCSASLPAATIHVPADHPTIQEAVDAAADDDTILVADGTWEGAAVSGRRLSIVSENGPDACLVSHTDTGFALSTNSAVTVEGFTVSGKGVGIVANGNCLITNCIITWNWEGGIVLDDSRATIRNCVISTNLNTWFGGGGIHAWNDFTAENCLFYDNSSWYDPFYEYYGGQGGAIWCTFSSPTIINCTFIDNDATNGGGAIASSQDHAAAAGSRAGERGGDVITLENCIFWSNSATLGDELYMTWGARAVVSYSAIDGGSGSIHGSYSFGPGVITGDPSFVTGSLGDHFLSQRAAGQGVDSRCVNAGNPATPLLQGTTRTDLVPDSGIIDMGFHYLEPSEPEPPSAFLATGPGPAAGNHPLVRVFPPEQGATHIAQWPAYGASSYGVNVTTGDLDGDGSSEIVTGAGPGAVYGPHVRAFTPEGEAVDGLSYLAYGTHKFGVNVACGDLDGDGRDELVTGAGPGAVFGPHVRGWNYDAAAVWPISGVNFFAYGTPRWGVNVAAGDIDGDGFDEIVTGPGPGDIYGPHVRGWNVDGGAVTTITGVNHLAYGTNRKGVRVACGDVDGDGIDEIVTAPGPSPVFGAHIRGWDYDGGSLNEIPGIDFFAWEPSESMYGATVTAFTDLNNDGRAEMVCGQGPDPVAHTPLKVFTYNGTNTSPLFDLDAYGDGGLTHGVNGAAGTH